MNEESMLQHLPENVVIPEFFESLAGPHPKVPKTISGRLRFDIGNDHWLVTFDKGMVSTARSNASADCVARTDKVTMEGIIQGRLNAMAALLRGLLQVEGKTLLLALFRDLLTAPVAEHESQRLGKDTGRRE
jgi:putative sterol carrier protein